jgi:hypothetical protein
VSGPLFPGTPPEPPTDPEELKNALQALTGQIPSLTGQTPAVMAPPTGQSPVAPGTGQSPLPTGQVPAWSAPAYSSPAPPIAPERQTRHSAPPSLPPGWGPAATAVNSFRHIENPLVLFLQPQGHGPIIIDLTSHEFTWTTPLAQFPDHPGIVSVGTQPITLNSPSPMVRPGQDLDALLWLIGLAAFPAGRAPWLGADEKFRLRRWPYFEALDHTPEQEKIIKVLARGFMTVDKLAQSAKTDRSEAQRVVNALALMMALRRSGGDNALPGITAPGMGADLSSLPPPGRG